jgi:Fe-S-cluster-containing dehydrogenase component/CRP-like cAMP-binding protein
MMAAAWPEVVWDAPVLRGLDPRARSEIQASGRVRSLAAGEVLYRAGDPADALFVVASGACTLHGVRRGDAQPTVIRRAGSGETFGEDATAFSFSTRQLEARSETSTTVAEVPAVVLKRALGRAGGAPLLERIERSLRRAATLDLLRTASFTASLPEAELHLLLDAARHREIPRGEPVYREGDPAKDAFLVVDGLLQAQSDDGGAPRVEAYLARGDVFGDEEIEASRSGERRRIGVVAAGPSWLVAFPADVFAGVARRAGGRLAAARRLRSEAPALPAGATTAHVFRDLYRMRVARSLLVIDQNACVRCGHCVSSCADAHEDGVSRLVRRGDKIVAQARAEPLMIPNSCQHCKNPSCMIDCPTGAIGRDARGEVFIHEALCTGCGSCAKACPWDNIQLAPRKDSAPFPAVAVKCDLCQGKHGGPQCVAACPTEAIARIEPTLAFAELGAAQAAVMPPRAPAWPWIAGAALASAGGLPLAAALGRLGSGVVAGVLFTIVAGYALAKRRLRRIRVWSGARSLFVAHVALGLFAVGVVAAHAGSSSLAGVAGALSVAFALAVATGIFGAVAGAILPPRLTRIERASALPEELAALPKAIDERIFGALSGTSEAVKRAFVETLAPYQRAPLGPLLLLLSGRSLRDEEAALGRRAGVREAGPLVRLVAEHRAVRAQRILTMILRGWLVPHLAATTAALVLLVLHVVAALHLAGGGR